MKTVAIVQARLGSSRLPCKTLLPLPTGRVVVEEVLHRVSQVEGVDAIVCAIPGDDLDIMRPYVRRVPNVILAAGPEHDVLKRYAIAAAATRADVILRITADCPLLNPDVCGDLLRLRASADAGYASNVYPVRHFPHGWDCEAFTRDALNLADTRATETYDREHVCPFMARHPDIPRVYLKSVTDRSHLMWTLDDIGDFRRIWHVMSNGLEEKLAA